MFTAYSSVYKDCISYVWVLSKRNTLAAKDNSLHRRRKGLVMHPVEQVALFSNQCDQQLAGGPTSSTVVV